VAEGEFPFEIEVTFEDILEVGLKVPSVVRSVITDRKRNIRTRRSPPRETSDEASLWSVAGGRVRFDLVLFGLRLCDMAVEFRMSYFSGCRCHWFVSIDSLHVGVAPQHNRPRMNEKECTVVCMVMALLYRLVQETLPGARSGLGGCSADVEPGRPGGWGVGMLDEHGLVFHRWERRYESSDIHGVFHC
jgi:hypothetical protein